MADVNYLPDPEISDVYREQLEFLLEHVAPAECPHFDTCPSCQRMIRVSKELLPFDVRIPIQISGSTGSDDTSQPGPKTENNE